MMYADDLMLYARSLPALVEMIETLSWELHQIGLQLNAAKSKIFTTKPLDHPMYVEVSQDLVHVLHEGSSHKYLGRHIPGNLKQRGRVELHHRKTIAWAKFNKHRTILTNKHVSLKLRLKFFNAVVTPAMLFSLHTLALTKMQLENINVLQIVGWVRVNGEDWSETMRRMNHRLSVALELFLIPPWTEQLAKRQFQFAAKVASEQSWSSVVGHWTCTAGRQANFDSMPSRKRGRPLVKWDDKLSNITSQFFPLHHGWLAAAKMPFWLNARQFFVSHFVDL